MRVYQPSYLQMAQQQPRIASDHGGQLTWRAKPNRALPTQHGVAEPMTRGGPPPEQRGANPTAGRSQMVTLREQVLDSQARIKKMQSRGGDFKPQRMRRTKRGWIAQQLQRKWITRAQRTKRRAKGGWVTRARWDPQLQCIIHLQRCRTLKEAPQITGHKDTAHPKYKRKETLKQPRTYEEKDAAHPRYKMEQRGLRPLPGSSLCGDTSEPVTPTCAMRTTQIQGQVSSLEHGQQQQSNRRDDKIWEIGAPLEGRIEDGSQNETNKDSWAASQQPGYRGHGIAAQRNQAGAQVIPLWLQREQSYFSTEERDYFTAAALEGKVSQTHYANPDADMCYGYPLCARILNSSGLVSNTTRHFLRMHNASNREYVVTPHGDPQNQTRIKIGGITARRTGADPPALSMIREYNPEVGTQRQPKDRPKGNPGKRNRVIKQKPREKPKRRQGRRKYRPSPQEQLVAGRPALQPSIVGQQPETD